MAAETVDWHEELSLKGKLDLVGHDAYPSLIDSLAGIDLMGTLGRPPRELFVGRFGSKAEKTLPIVGELINDGF